jgi:hypothetical protein
MRQFLMAVLLMSLWSTRAAAQCGSSFPSDVTIAASVATATSKTYTIGGGNVTFQVPCRQDADAGTFTMALDNIDAGMTRATLLLTDPAWNGASFCYWVRVFKHPSYLDDCTGNGCQGSIIAYDQIIRTATVDSCGVVDLQCDEFTGRLSPAQTDKIDITLSGANDVYVVQVYYDFISGNVYSQPTLDLITYTGSSPATFSYGPVTRDQCR